jgi:signal-transduction protein with cAMP-binding, CBS, and nucleotidyltransferase domain
MIAKQLINPAILPLSIDDTVLHAMTYMEEVHLLHLPVIDHGLLCGIISEPDLQVAVNKNAEIRNCQLSFGRLFVYDNQHYYDVIKAFTGSDLTMLPVLSNFNNFLGIITLPALVGCFSSITAIDNPGGIIILEMNEKDYSISEIAQIVESNDAQILSLYINKHPDTTRVEVTLKVNLIDIGAILQTFFRFNYLVKASWSEEDSFREGLQDRYDSLMNYLNI